MGSERQDVAPEIFDELRFCYRGFDGIQLLTRLPVQM